MDALDLLQNLQAINIREIASDAVKEHEEQIADLNASQLAQGRKSDGSEILPAYTPLTVELKQGKPGLAGVTDRVTLYDTGEHYRQLYAEVKGDDIEYGSHDPKSAKLEKKYATAKGSLYGLTDFNKEELVDHYVEGTFLAKLHDATGL